MRLPQFTQSNDRSLLTQDVVWLAVFAALAWVSPNRGPAEIEMLAAYAVLQIAAPRLRAANTRVGNLAVIALKLVLGFLLIGVTGGVASDYFFILLLPVVSAATTLSASGTALCTVFACLAYLAFVPVALHLGFAFEPAQYSKLLLRIIFLMIVAYLTYTLACKNKEAAAQAQAAARQLAETNERLVEAELSVRRSERLVALGQLTAGLAHELRNPLGTIKASAEMLSERLPTGSGLLSELSGYISSEVDRTNSLVERFLDFARPVKLRLGLIDLNQLIESAVEEISRQSVGVRALIHKNFDPGVPVIVGDAELLGRVVVNLIHNALQASPENTAVTIKTRSLVGEVEFAVIDRGSGVRPEHREQIFNPFFTTKPTGVGLGLAICSKIVDEHGGKITVESEPGRGAIFLVRLPSRPLQSM